jgi:hypothetical protein
MKSIKSLLLLLDAQILVSAQQPTTEAYNVAVSWVCTSSCQKSAFDCQRLRRQLRRNSLLAKRGSMSRKMRRS